MDAINKAKQNLELVKVYNEEFGKLKLVVGKSGSGKNYLCDQEGWKAIPSFTTRPIRPSEQNYNEHIFVSMDEYEFVHKDKPKAAYTFYNGNHYWSTLEQIEGITEMDVRDLNNEKPVPIYSAYVIDPDGVFNLIKKKEVYNIKRDFEIIYVEANFIKRFFRMIRRGDGWKKALQRIMNDRKAFAGFVKKVNNETDLPLTIITT